MDHPARFDTLDRFHQRRENRPIILDSVSLYMDDDNAESQILEVGLEFETFVNRYENVKPPLRPSREFRIRKCSPLHL